MTKKINIPFEGFYYSIADSEINRALTNLFDFEGCEDAEYFPDNLDFYNDFQSLIDFEPVHKEYSEKYVDWLANEIDIKSLSFDKLDSPKYYNFRSDEIIGQISDDDILKMFKEVDKDLLNGWIEERHKSRSGFVSFYSHDIKEWPENVLDWDQTQLGTLLRAYIEHEKGEGLNDALIYSYEYIRVNEWIFEHLPKQCQDLANAAYEAWDKKTKGKTK